MERPKKYDRRTILGTGFVLAAGGTFAYQFLQDPEFRETVLNAESARKKPDAIFIGKVRISAASIGYEDIAAPIGIAINKIPLTILSEINGQKYDRQDTIVIQNPRIRSSIQPWQSEQVVRPVYKQQFRGWAPLQVRIIGREEKFETIYLDTSDDTVQFSEGGQVVPIRVVDKDKLVTQTNQEISYTEVDKVILEQKQNP